MNENPTSMNQRIQKKKDDSLQKIGLAYMNFIRWLCFIPGGLSVGALIIFVCVLACALLVSMFPYVVSNVFLRPELIFFLSRVPAHVCIPAAVFGFCTTTFGANIAPSKNKKIPGFIMAFALCLIFLSDYDITLPDQLEYFANVFKYATILSSLITALFLKRVESADLTDLPKDKLASEAPQ
jgi:hypothetical protein